MTCVGIREFKGHVTRYVEMAARGDDVMITKRGTAMARLVGEPRRATPLRDQLAPLAAEGLIVMPSVARRRRLPPLVTVRGVPASLVLLEDRR